MNKSIVFALSALVAAAVIAQPVVGTLSNVEGLVTITQNNQLVTAGNGSTVVDGARIISTSTGHVTIDVNDCKVTLNPNESVTIDSSVSCDKFRAAVLRTDGPLTTAGGSGGGFGAGLGVIGFGALAMYIAYRDRSISPR